MTTGTPYWPERSDTRKTYEALSGDQVCDVAVIGGGITGALLAYRMVNVGLDTVLVDKGRFAAGSTSASTALISYEFDLMLSELSDRLGEKAAVKAYKLCYEATSRIKELVHELEDPCDYEDKVSIRVSNTETDFESLKRESKTRNLHGLKVELLDRAELKSAFGITAAMGLVSGNAAQIDPCRLAHRLIGRGSKRGLRAFENTRVTTFERISQGVRLGTPGGATVLAKRVLFATGYESEKFLGKTKAEQSTDYCLISNPLKSMGKLAKCHMVENTESYLYMSTFGNRVMVGVEGKAFHSPADRSRFMDRRIKQVLERVREYLPDQEITVAYHWASTFVNSPDSLPYIGTTDRLPDAIFALGYGGNGIASSAMLAPIIVDLLVKGSNADAGLFALER